MKDAINIHELPLATLNKRIGYMLKKTNEYENEVKDLHVCISLGNRKTDKLVPSVSLRPVIDCKNCKACNRLCYDIRNDAVYPSVMDSRARNAAILKLDRERYFREISDFCKKQVAFRWHVGGDIPDSDYLDHMCKVARENEHCKFLVFVKVFNVVNEYFNGHEKPKNLQVIFSGWKGLEMDNPHNFPTSHPKFADGTTSAREDAFPCGGNCSECLVHNVGCWALKSGEQVYFNAH